MEVLLKDEKIVAALVALLTLVTPVIADTFPQTAAPGNIPPKIYMLESDYDICADDDWGGSRPDGFDLQLDGCVNIPDEDEDTYRLGEYAFTGEQLGWLVLVRDLNGADDISYAKFTVDGYTEALCEEVGASEYQYDDQVPADLAAHEGFDPDFDKVFMCVLTVEPSWYGSKTVNIDGYDQAGAASTMGIAQTWWFNPVVMVDLSTNDGAPYIWYEDGVPGQTVMSGNKLLITNLAEGAVDLWAFIAAEDLTDPSHSGAKCPTSNVLDVDLTDNQGDPAGMDYRAKIGTYEDDDWHDITNKDNSEGCSVDECANAQPLIPGDDSLIANQHDAEVQFRLTYPVPCIGDFTEGNIMVLVRAV